MRILIVNWHPSIVGGTETYLQAAVREFSVRGCEVALLHGYEPNADAERIAPAALKRPAFFLDRLGVAGTLRAVEEWAPSVTYIHSWRSAKVESALLDHYPSALFLHDYHRTCPTGRKCHSFPHIHPCARKAGPACIGLHYLARCGGLSPLTMLKDYRRQSLQLGMLNRYPAILVASRHMREEVARSGVSPDRLHVAPLFPPRCSPDATPPRARAIQGKILMVGRLVTLKGTEFLIRAIPGASAKLGFALKLTIAGTGQDEMRLRKLADDLCVPTRFAGWLGRDALEVLMRDSDLLAVPSLWPEPFGLTGIEAGCVGLPSVGFDVGGIRDWLTPGLTGELAPGDPPTVEGLVDAMVRALGNSAYHGGLREGAWKTAKRFDVASHFGAVEAVLEGVGNASPVSA